MKQPVPVSLSIRRPQCDEAVRAPLRGFWQSVVRLVSDEGGISSIEYSTLGGAMSGIIFFAASALQNAQAAAIERFVQPG